jgi:S1-C subfamily serine protease
VPGGPADSAGLTAGERNGDIVVGVDGQPVQSIDDLIVYLTRYGTAGDTVRLALLRGASRLEVEVTLGARPE